MKKLLVLIFIIRSCQAFSVHKPLETRTITYTCPDDLADFLAQELTVWNYAADNIFTFCRVDSNPILTVTSTDKDLGNNPNGDQILGLTYQFKHPLIILKKPYMVSVILHELGHALGLKHSDDPLSIMQSRVGYLPYLGQDDIDGIRELYGLSPKLFNDFSIKVNRRTVTCKFTSKLDFYFDDGVYFYDKKRCSRRLPRGVYSIKAYDDLHHIIVKKEFVIK